MIFIWRPGARYTTTAMPSMDDAIHADIEEAVQRDLYLTSETHLSLVEAKVQDLATRIQAMRLRALTMPALAAQELTDEIHKLIAELNALKAAEG